MKNYIVTALLLFVGSTQLSAQRAPDPTSQEVCEAVVNFLNELVVSNFNNYMGEELPKGPGSKYKVYASTMPFTSAMMTMIEDTNATSTYRSAKIIFFEQQKLDKVMSPEMVKLYNQVVKSLDDCLSNNGFLIPDPLEPGAAPVYEHTYMLPWASEYNKAISTSTITVTTRVNVHHSEGGKKFNHRFEILIVRN